MAGAPSGARKRKQTQKHNTPVITLDPSIQEARQANNSEMIQWFARTVLQQVEAKKQYRKKPRILNALHNRWLLSCTYMEDVTRTHLFTIASTYQCDCLGVRGMHHIRGLRSLYDEASGAKQAYH